MIQAQLGFIQSLFDMLLLFNGVKQSAKHSVSSVSQIRGCTESKVSIDVIRIVVSMECEDIAEIPTKKNKMKNEN